MWHELSQMMFHELTKVLKICTQVPNIGIRLHVRGGNGGFMEGSK